MRPGSEKGPFWILAGHFLTGDVVTAVDEQTREDQLIRASDLLSQTSNIIEDMIKGEQIYRRATDRRRSFKSIFSHASALLHQLENLDPRNRLSLMGSLEGQPMTTTDYAPDDNERGASAEPPKTVTMGVTGTRINEYLLFAGYLVRIRDNAEAYFQRSKSDGIGAPATPDPILFGIEALAELWRIYSGRKITSSQKYREFGLFVVQFFALLQPHPAPPQVRTGLRNFIARRGKSGQFES